MIDELRHTRAHERNKAYTIPIVHFTQDLYLSFNYYLQKIIEDIVVREFSMNVRMLGTWVSTNPSSYRTYPVIGLPSTSDSRSSIFRRKESL